MVLLPVVQVFRWDQRLEWQRFYDTIHTRDANNSTASVVWPSYLPVHDQIHSLYDLSMSQISAQGLQPDWDIPAEFDLCLGGVNSRLPEKVISSMTQNLPISTRCSYENEEQSQLNKLLQQNRSSLQVLHPPSSQSCPETALQRACTACKGTIE